MAGSYHHVVDTFDRLIPPEDLDGMLEHGGDVYEAVEEMYGMIHWLAARLAEAEGTARDDVIDDAEAHYREGLAIGRLGCETVDPNHPEGDSDS